MIDENRTNVARRRVAVTANDYRFPNECLLCGASNVIPTPVEFKRVLLLPFIAAGQTVTVSIPLCEKHSSEYTERKTRQNTLMNVSFVAGFGMFALMYGFAALQKPGSSLPAAFNYLAMIIAPLSGILVLASIVLLLTKNRNFSIKFRQKGWRSDYHIYSFPDEDSMKRFIVANSDASRESIPAAWNLAERADGL
jgi:hypothetical protein